MQTTTGPPGGGRPTQQHSHSRRTCAPQRGRRTQQLAPNQSRKGRPQTSEGRLHVESNLKTAIPTDEPVPRGAAVERSSRCRKRARGGPGRKRTLPKGGRQQPNRAPIGGRATPERRNRARTGPSQEREKWSDPGDEKGSFQRSYLTCTGVPIDERGPQTEEQANAATGTGTAERNPTKAGPKQGQANAACCTQPEEDERRRREEEGGGEGERMTLKYANNKTNCVNVYVGLFNSISAVDPYNKRECGSRATYIL